MVVEQKEQEPIVKMRDRNVNAAAHSALARGIEALNEGEVTEETEGENSSQIQITYSIGFFQKFASWTPSLIILMTTCLRWKSV